MDSRPDKDLASGPDPDRELIQNNFPTNTQGLNPATIWTLSIPRRVTFTRTLLGLGLG